jgi:uncharacterized lipoprotein YmbA
MMSRFSILRMSFALGLVVILLLGCSHSPPTRYYDLGPLPGKGASAPSEACVSIGIGPLKIPEYLDRSDIVTRITSHELRVAEFDKWAEPLEDNFPRVLAENLSSLLCTKTVVIFPWKGSFPLDYRVYVDVIRMDGKLGENAVLDVSWTIMSGAGKKGALMMKQSSYKDSTGGQDYGDFVAAQSRNVGALSRDIAEAIKTLEQKPRQ